MSELHDEIFYYCQVTLMYTRSTYSAKECLALVSLRECKILNLYKYIIYLCWSIDSGISWSLDSAISWSLDSGISWGLDSAISWSLDSAISWSLDSAVHDHQQAHERVAALLCIMRAASDLYQTLLSKTNCIPKA